MPAELLIVAYAVLIGLLLPLRALARRRKDTPTPHPAAIAAECLLLTTLAGAVTVVAEIPSEEMGLAARGTPLLVRIVLAVAVVIGLDLVGLALHRHSGAARMPPQGGPHLRGPGGNLGFIAVCLAAGIWEETAFRALPLALADANSLPRIAAVVLGTVAFALNHARQGAQAVATSAYFGLVFTAIFLATGSLVATIAAHVAGNLFAALFIQPRIRAVSEFQFF